MTVTDQREQKSLAAVWLGMVANIFLATGKTAIGILGHSPALLADLRCRLLCGGHRLHPYVTQASR